MYLIKYHSNNELNLLEIQSCETTQIKKFKNFLIKSNNWSITLCTISFYRVLSQVVRGSEYSAPQIKDFTLIVFTVVLVKHSSSSL
jgi:hypothetical protein